MGRNRRRHQFQKRTWEDAREQALRDNERWNQQKEALKVLEEEMLQKQIYVRQINFQVSALQLRNFLERNFSFLHVEQVTIQTVSASSNPFRLPPVVLSKSLRKNDMRHNGTAIVQLQSATERTDLLQCLQRSNEIMAPGVGSGRGPTGPRIKILPNKIPQKGQFYHKSGSQYSFRMRNMEVGSIVQKPGLAMPGPHFVCGEALRGSDLKFSLDLVRRALILSFWIYPTLYKLEVRFKHICGYLTLQSDGSILLTLRMPPRIYKAVPKPRFGFGESHFALSLIDMVNLCANLELEGGYRSGVGPCPSFRPGPDDGYDDPFEWPAGPGAQQMDAILMEKEDVLWMRTADFTPEKMLASCLSYRLTLGEAFLVDDAFTSSLRDFGLLPRHNTVGRALKMLLSDPEMPHEAEAQLATLPLAVRYHLMVLLRWRAVVNRWQLDAQLFNMLHAHTEAVCVKALAVLAGALRPIVDLHHELSHLLADFAEDEEEPRVGRYGQLLINTKMEPHCVDVVRLLVTPTRVCVLPPESEMSNRVVRTFTNPETVPSGFPLLTGADFARVSVGDEHGRKLYGVGAENSEIWKSMRNLLNDGIRLFDRHYVFLAYSSSQLKDCSLWMVADSRRGGNSQLLADCLRAWMGDFMGRIKIVAKCAARMGQCFSTTAATVGVTYSEEARIPDIEVGQYCFSDGCGEISRELLLDVLKKVPFGPRNKQDVTAIQVRFRGCKGVLSLNDRLYGRQLLYRPSMEKFGSTHRDLEVCSLANFVPCYLNRHVITLLVSNGVPRNVFITRQAQAIAKLDAMMQDRRVACDLLPRLGGPESGAVNMLTTMLKGGMSPRADPFLHRCLAAVRRQQLMDMKRKCRILVPQGAVLMGSIDQTGALGPEQLFLQVRADITQHDSPWVVITGPVLIAKHPVMHPGDVRVYTAVDAPALRSHKNELKFPQYGLRPIPNQLSGSDLDGDQYAVIWDLEYFPPGPNKEPMDYTPPKPKEVAQVQVSDILDHFLNHALNDNLGRIANSWLAQADICVKDSGRDEGCANYSKCIRLAQLHSIAVDFPKSGVPAQLEKDLLASEVPHWLEAKNRVSYESKSILGALYDAVVGYEAKEGRKGPDVGWEMGNRAQQGWPADLRVEGWEAWAKVARREHESYGRDLRELMNRYHVHFEGELLTGCVLKFHRYHKERQHDIKEQLMRQVRMQCHRSRMHVMEAVLSRSEPVMWAEMKAAAESGETQYPTLEEIKDLVECKPHLRLHLSQLACACYRATYFPDERVAAASNDSSDDSDADEATHPTSDAATAAAGVSHSTVHVEHREKKWTLYSFPWVVAADYLVPLIRERRS